MKVYAVEWCPCTYESEYALLSLHATERGAERALHMREIEKAAAEKEMHDAGYPKYRESSEGRVRAIEVNEDTTHER